MPDNSNAASGGAGFTSLLLIAFIVLKLCNVIDWSWWWVLSPFWIPLGLVIIGFGIYVLYLVFIKWPDEKKRIASGMSEMAWKAKKKGRPYVEPKSKWQQRFEEMQAKQKVDKN